ncbi:hypothetical protein BKA67DRAFT_665015 [Truncatella angustata]|uniref:Uncharacterized protein n=1 Tax=Truncatella angustata TaxID=152316 RepID=A0A9P8RG08_9PEZI|nr:uncharacterized protein BKA67DRAFT_665015 [Truncatella angustata]KAH6645177.1 hypothetical protein BKA67DRAFT_665015 [Truncatella angustata]
MATINIARRDSASSMSGVALAGVLIGATLVLILSLVLFSRYESWAKKRRKRPQRTPATSDDDDVAPVSWAGLLFSNARSRHKPSLAKLHPQALSMVETDSLRIKTHVKRAEDSQATVPTTFLTVAIIVIEANGIMLI